MPLAVTNLVTSILSDYSLQMTFTAPANSGAGPFTYQVSLFDLAKAHSTVLTPTVTAKGNSVTLKAPISNDQWEWPGGAYVQGGQPHDGMAYFSIAAVGANGAAGPAKWSPLQETPVPVSAAPLPSYAKTSPAAPITLCATPSTCNSSTTGNYTYNQTIYFQISISQNAK